MLKGYKALGRFYLQEPLVHGWDDRDACWYAQDKKILGDRKIVRVLKGWKESRDLSLRLERYQQLHHPNFPVLELFSWEKVEEDWLLFLVFPFHPCKSFMGDQGELLLEPQSFLTLFQQMSLTWDFCLTNPWGYQIKAWSPQNWFVDETLTLKCFAFSLEDRLEDPRLLLTQWLYWFDPSCLTLKEKELVWGEACQTLWEKVRLNTSYPQTTRDLLQKLASLLLAPDGQEQTQWMTSVVMKPVESLSFWDRVRNLF